VKQVMAGMKRRVFLEQSGRVGGGAMLGLLAAGPAPGDRASGAGKARMTGGAGSPLRIVCDPADPIAASAPARWALGHLREVLATREIATRLAERIDLVPPGQSCLLAAGSRAPAAREMLTQASLSLPDAPEALALVHGRLAGRSGLLIGGSDARGLAYALLEAADQAAYSHDPLAILNLPRPIAERPAHPIRSVARCFVSELEDKPWFYDRSFWQRYLTMLAAQRFNRFSLTLGIGYDFLKEVSDSYLHFAYPFLLAVPGYRVRAVPLPDDERDRNLETLRFISQAATERGLHFQLGLWTHGYDWASNPGVNYTIEGLTPENHAAYCRDALRMLLQACPAIQGLTFRIHGESGVPEAHYDFWKTVFDGIVQCGRRIEIDMHAKGIDRGMIGVALATGMPVNVSPKFWAEHMGLPYHQASIRSLELPPRGAADEGFFAKSSGSRRFLRYGYGDLLAENRRYGVLFRLWPGTQRLLMWGDPAMAAAYARASGFCGSLGIEWCEPLSFKGRKGSGLPGGRAAYADAALRPAGGDWEKYLYTYRLWGRLLYDPDAPAESWQRFLRREFGAGAPAAEAALAHASRILPLVTTAHLPSAANNSYWPEIYTNMPIVDEKRPHPYGDTPGPKRFGTVSPLDPELFSTIDELVEELVHESASGKYSPLEVAHWLDGLAREAMHHLAGLEAGSTDPHDPGLRRWANDIAIQSALGRFFAAKLRAGVLYSLYTRSGSETAWQEALRAYREARAAWAELGARAEGVYVRDITFGRAAHLRGHWMDRLAAIDQDIADMEARPGSAAGPPGEPPARLDDAVRAALAPVPARPHPAAAHTLPAPFHPGKAVIVTMVLGESDPAHPPISAQLRYRRVNQSEPYLEEAMRAAGRHYRAVIPGVYTDSPYPLQYFFKLHDGQGRVWLYPGLAADFTSQPYFVVRQAMAVDRLK
jgi:hypothetical protein